MNQSRNQKLPEDNISEKMTKDLKYLNLKELEAIKELKRRLKETYGEKLKEIRLFGSKARGDFDPESDIDIFLLFNSDIDWKFENEVWDLAYEIDLQFGVLFNVIIFSTKQLKDPKMRILPFFRSVKKEGVKV